MLADSPPLPLIIDDVDHSDSITIQDEEGILLALRHRNRVRCIRLDFPVPKLHRLVMVSEDEFPILEYLFLGPPSRQHMGLKLSESLRAPHLRHLVLWNFAFPVRSPLLMTSMGLVTLSLDLISPSAYSHIPNGSHRCLRFRPSPLPFTPPSPTPMSNGKCCVGRV